MKQMFNLPQYKTVNYRMNPQTGYFTKTETQPDKTPVMRLPFELRVSPTQAEKIKCNAGELIHSRDRRKNGSYLFFTGLQKTYFQNWYLGNDFEMMHGQKIISIILFHFGEDNSRLTVYYFSRFDKENTEQRLRFAHFAIPQLLNTKGRFAPASDVFNFSNTAPQDGVNHLSKDNVLK